MAEQDNLAQDIKSAAGGFGADVVGIAAASTWDEYVPEGYRPYDLLPGARSVIVVGARGPTAGAWRSPNPRVMEVLGLNFANDRAIAARRQHARAGVCPHLMCVQTYKHIGKTPCMAACPADDGGCR